MSMMMVEQVRQHEESYRGAIAEVLRVPSRQVDLTIKSFGEDRRRLGLYMGNSGETDSPWSIYDVTMGAIIDVTVHLEQAAQVTWVEAALDSDRESLVNFTEMLTEELEDYGIDMGAHAVEYGFLKVVNPVGSTHGFATPFLGDDFDDDDNDGDNDDDATFLGDDDDRDGEWSYGSEGSMGSYGSDSYKGGDSSEMSQVTITLSMSGVSTADFNEDTCTRFEASFADVVGVEIGTNGMNVEVVATDTNDLLADAHLPAPSLRRLSWFGVTVDATVTVASAEAVGVRLVLYSPEFSSQLAAALASTEPYPVLPAVATDSLSADVSSITVFEVEEPTPLPTKAVFFGLVENTLAPTVPTSAPTRAPTAPTSAPTVPTALPTAAPTTTPTISLVQPTNAPTQRALCADSGCYASEGGLCYTFTVGDTLDFKCGCSPSFLCVGGCEEGHQPNTCIPDTTAPTFGPTHKTHVPTSNPTRTLPTSEPTKVPTEVTAVPTMVPTEVTAVPTVVPTHATLTPTAVPTKTPTLLVIPEVQVVPLVPTPVVYTAPTLVPTHTAMSDITSSCFGHTKALCGSHVDFVECENCISQNELVLMDGECDAETHGDSWFPTELAFDYCHALLMLRAQPDNGVSMGAVDDLQDSILTQGARSAVLKAAGDETTIPVANELVTAAMHLDEQGGVQLGTFYDDDGASGDGMTLSSGVEESHIYSSVTEDAHQQALEAVTALVPTPTPVDSVDSVSVGAELVPMEAVPVEAASTESEVVPMAAAERESVPVEVEAAEVEAEQNLEGAQEELHPLQTQLQEETNHAGAFTDAEVANSVPLLLATDGEQQRPHRQPNQRDEVLAEDGVVIEGEGRLLHARE
jgi:hypothetical protein